MRLVEEKRGLGVHVTGYGVRYYLLLLATSTVVLTVPSTGKPELLQPVPLLRWKS